MTKHSSKFLLVAVLGSGLLVACGTGGGGSAEAPAQTSTSATVTVTAVNSYIGGLISNTSESSTPVDANLVILAEDDTGEPEAVN